MTAHKTKAVKVITLLELTPSPSGLPESINLKKWAILLIIRFDYTYKKEG